MEKLGYTHTFEAPNERNTADLHEDQQDINSPDIGMDGHVPDQYPGRLHNVYTVEQGGPLGFGGMVRMALGMNRRYG